MIQSPTAAVRGWAAGRADPSQSFCATAQGRGIVKDDLAVLQADADFLP